MRNLGKLFLAMLLICLLACSNETVEGSAPLILPEDAGMVEVDIKPPGCLENENLSRLIPVLRGGKTHPTGRGEHDAVFEHCNQRIILFGGNDFQPEECADFGPKRFSNETWVYSLEYENWVRVTTEVGPSPRGRHEMVFDSTRNRVLLFGGRYREEGASSFANYDLYNDVWSFDVNTDLWAELETTGDGPSPRTNSAMVYDSVNDQLVVFGGSIARTGTEFLPLADTYILDLESLVWRRLDADGPVPRLFHRLIFLEGRNQVLMYGGGGRNAFTGPFINDVWILDLENQTWNQVWRPSDSRGPFARINPALMYDDEAQQVFMFAGHDDTAVGHRNDVWTFDLNSNLWTEVIPGDTGAGEGCSRFCSCEPDFVNVDIASPERRQYHTFTHISGTRDIILFGGKGDCGYLDDTWRFDLNALSWEELDPAGQGEACMRTGQEGCTDLCY